MWRSDFRKSERRDVSCLG